MEHHMRNLLLLSSVLLLSACTNVELGSHIIKQISPSTYSSHTGSFKVGNTYKIKGKRYHPKETYNFKQTGIASWYGPDFHGKLTANGEVYNQNDLTAAHKTLQLPSIIRVTNLENGKSVILRVNDRGPFAHSRILDLSSRAADLLDVKHKGTARIKLQVLGDESREVARVAKAGQPTRGMEVAYNRGVKPASKMASLTPEYMPKKPAYTLASARPVQPAAQIQKTTRINPSPVMDYNKTYGDYNGAYKAPVAAQAPPQQVTAQNAAYTKLGSSAENLVKTYTVKPSRLYVQTASFTQKTNAVKFAQKLQRYGGSKIEETLINGRNYYRVKLGPLNDVAHADSMLSTLIADGYNDALIVVDTQG
jgi:rare lipoprotein A